MQGRYNIESSATGSFIIGNGTSSVLRSNLVFASGSSFQITGSLSLKNTTESGGNGNVLTYNTTTGLVSYTASAAVGSGGNDYTYEIGEYVAAQGGVIFHRWKSNTAKGTPAGSGTYENYLVITTGSFINSGSANGTNMTQWIFGSATQDVSQTTTLSTSSWDGESNTDAILAVQNNSIMAAYKVRNCNHAGKTDWYLPSVYEMHKLQENIQEVLMGYQEAGITDGPSRFTNEQLTNLGYLITGPDSAEEIVRFWTSNQALPNLYDVAANNYNSNNCAYVVLLSLGNMLAGSYAGGALYPLPKSGQVSSIYWRASAIPIRKFSI